MFCWPRVPSFKGRKAFTRRHNNDPTELEVNTAPQPHVSKSARKEGSYGVDWVIDPDFQGKTGLLLYMEVRKVHLEYRRSLRASLSFATSFY